MDKHQARAIEEHDFSKWTAVYNTYHEAELIAAYNNRTTRVAHLYFYPAAIYNVFVVMVLHSPSGSKEATTFMNKPDIDFSFPKYPPLSFLSRKEHQDG